MDSNKTPSNVPSSERSEQLMERSGISAPPGPGYVIHRRFHNINGEELKVLNSHPLRQPYVYQVGKWIGYRPSPK